MSKGAGYGNTGLLGSFGTMGNIDLPLPPGVLALHIKDEVLSKIFDEDLIDEMGFEFIVKCQTSHFFFYDTFLYKLIKPMASENIK